MTSTASGPEAAPPPPPDESAGAGGLATVVERLSGEVERLEHELGEIDMLINQARTEAGRHEQKRSQAAEKLASLSASPATPAADLAEVNAQLVTLTRRAAVMEAQVDVLEGKRKALGRFHESLKALADELSSVEVDGPASASRADRAGDEEGLPPAVSRIVLTAQEDLRREIARAMHDGPAQSLTNIVLQAQIVERLVASNPENARGEVQALVGMVQQTLEATKSFIFDVRPMVLDDLGLVPTLRRAARDRGRRAGVAVEFDSIGADRRLPVELESGLFRILDEALAAYLGAAPDRVSLRLDWGDVLDARIRASRGSQEPEADQATAEATPAQSRESKGSKGAKHEPKELPPALQAMLEERRAEEERAAEAARRAKLVILPDSAWRDIRHRAATIGADAELLDEGSELRVRVALPAPDGAPAGG